MATMPMASLPCDGDGVCMVCKAPVPASLVIWICPDCSGDAITADPAPPVPDLVMVNSVGSCNDQLARLQFGTTVGEKGRTVEGFEIVEPPVDDETATEERQAGIARLLAGYTQHLQERTDYQVGYPANSNMDYYDDFRPLAHFMNFSLINTGDPFMGVARSEVAVLDLVNSGVHSRHFEVAVLDWFAHLWELQKEQYWGYITSSGTEANLYGLLVGRELFPNGILYASHDSHYSIFKASKMYRIECIKIDTLVSGEMNCADLKSKLLENAKYPAIVNVNIGTTMKGAIDDLDQIITTLEKCGFQNRYYIHCDSALSGIMLPFMKQAPKLSFRKPIGSINISGHKFIGCTVPCGVVITRMEHVEVLSAKVECRDSTIIGSRNGHASIFLWYKLCKKGCRGISKEVEICLRNAEYLEKRLKELGVSSSRNALSITVVFERPKDEMFVRRWELACEGNIAHVVVMPAVTMEKLTNFVEELSEKRRDWYQDNGFSIPCLAADIGLENCFCDLHGKYNS